MTPQKTKKQKKLEKSSIDCSTYYYWSNKRHLSGMFVYKKLGLESLSLSDRRWYRKLVKGLTPPYSQSYLLPDNGRTYNTRSSLRNTTKTFVTRTSTFRATFFLQHKRLNQLNDDFKKIDSIKKLKKFI